MRGRCALSTTPRLRHPLSISPFQTSNASFGNTAERILLLGNAHDTLDLLRLAALRSDMVTAVSLGPSAATRRFVARVAVEPHDRDPQPRDFDDIAAAPIALGDTEAENDMVREAGRRGVPVHVTGRPLVSDFSRFDFAAQRPLMRAAA